VLLALGVVPAFYVAHLPLHFDWTTYFTVYGFLILRAIFAAAVLYMIGFPRELLHNLRNRQKSQSFPSREVLAVLLPGAYVFLVLLLVFSYNDVIARFRFEASYDLILNRVDSWILGGHTVLDLSRSLLANHHWASQIGLK